MSGSFGSVRLGDDKPCNVVGIGQIKLRMHDGVVRTLTDVRYVPDLKKNLISLGTLHTNGFRYKTVDDGLKVSKGAMTVMRARRISGNIYLLLGSTIVGGAAIVESESDSTTLWHMRLGHIGEHGMTELHKRGLLTGVKSCKMDFCKFCVMGK